MNKSGKALFWAILLCMAAGSGFAQMLPIQLEPNTINPTPGLRDIRQNPQTNVNITETQAVELARQRFEGTILRISLVGEGASQRYQIRMENEGKVFTVFVHVATGRVTGGN